MGDDGFLDRLAGGETRRGRQPLEFYELKSEILTQLQALRLDPDRPLVALDADEVLLVFARHLVRFVETRGVRLTLTSYRLDGAFTRIDDGSALTKEEGWAEIGAFFASETARQEIAAGAVDGVAALQEIAQVIVLTNVPARAHAARIENLRGHGLDLPVVANSGGKGRALRYLWDATRGPVVFVDDSASQIGSAHARAPAVGRVHFVADPDLRRLAAPSEHAQAFPEDWAGCAAAARALLVPD